MGSHSIPNEKCGIIIIYKQIQQREGFKRSGGLNIWNCDGIKPCNVSHKNQWLHIIIKWLSVILFSLKANVVGGGYRTHPNIDASLEGLGPKWIIKTKRRWQRCPPLRGTARNQWEKRRIKSYKNELHLSFHCQNEITDFILLGIKENSEVKSEGRRQWNERCLLQLFDQKYL